MNNYSFKHIVRQGLSGLFHICCQELRATFKDQGVLIFFLLVPLAYPLVYAFIYTSEVVREVPVTAVDQSHSSSSREFLRLADGSPDIKIQPTAQTWKKPKNWSKDRTYTGIIYIPEKLQ